MALVRARFWLPALALSACALACGLTADFSNLQNGYCASPPPERVFCADFDEKPLPFPFASLRSEGGGIEINSDAFVSPPNSAYERDEPGVAPMGVIDSSLRAYFPVIPPPPSTLAFEFVIQQVSVTPGPLESPRLVVAALDLLAPAPMPGDGGAMSNDAGPVDAAPLDGGSSDGSIDGGPRDGGANDGAANDGGASEGGTNDAGTMSNGGGTMQKYSLQFTLVLNTNAMLNSDTLTLALEEVSTVPGPCPSYNSHTIPALGGASGPLVIEQFPAWNDLRVTVQLAPGSASGALPMAQALVSIGGMQVPEIPLCMNFVPNQAGIGIGSIFKSDSQSVWANRYDNVTFDVTPAP
jgi:hypothetical protein